MPRGGAAGKGTMLVGNLFSLKFSIFIFLFDFSCVLVLLSLVGVEIKTRIGVGNGEAGGGRGKNRGNTEPGNNEILTRRNKRRLRGKGSRFSNCYGLRTSLPSGGN